MNTATRYRATVAVLTLALLVVALAYQQQRAQLDSARRGGISLARSYVQLNDQMQRERVLLGQQLKRERERADKNEAAASRLRAVERGVIVPVGTLRTVERLRATGQLHNEALSN